MQNKSGFGRLWCILYPWFIYDAIRYLINGIFLNVIVISGRDAADVVSRYPYLNFIFALAAALAALPVMIWLYREDEKRRRVQKNAGQVTMPCKTADWLVIGMAGVSACIALNQLLRILSPVLLTDRYKKAAQTLYAENGIWQILLVVIAMPALEEMIFRGLVFKRMREWKGFWVSAVVSALLFAVYHGNLYQGVYAFLSALMLCIIYETYNRITGVIVMHGIINATSLAGTALGIYKIRGGMLAGVFLGSAVITGGCIGWIWKRGRDKGVAGSGKENR